METKKGRMSRVYEPGGRKASETRVKHGAKQGEPGMKRKAAPKTPKMGG